MKNAPISYTVMSQELSNIMESRLSSFCRRQRLWNAAISWDDVTEKILENDRVCGESTL